MDCSRRAALWRGMVLRRDRASRSVRRVRGLLVGVLVLAGEEVAVTAVDDLAHDGLEGLAEFGDGVVAAGEVVLAADEALELEEVAEVLDVVEVDTGVPDHPEGSAFPDDDPEWEGLGAEAFEGLLFGVDGEVAEFGPGEVWAFVEDVFGFFADSLSAFESACGRAEIGVGLDEVGDPGGLERVADGPGESRVTEFGLELDVVHGSMDRERGTGARTR